MIPVIIINYGCQFYLPHIVRHANAYNQNVILIGDDSNRHLITHFNISDYSDKAANFEELYQHLSTNGYNIELFCFQRWFILEEFMRGQNIKECFYIDSDVLLYANIDDEINKYKHFDFTLTHRCCGSNSFFRYDGLKKLCDFITKTYANKLSYNYEKIASHYYTRKKHGLPGGVCDMTLLEFYSYNICGNVGEMMHIVDGATWDHNINEPDHGFEMKNGIKNIQFINNTPFCSKNKEMIKFNSLHMQGGFVKNFIGNFI